MQNLFVCMREREKKRARMNIFTSLWQPLIDISWMRLKSPKTGSASKLAWVLHLQLFFATCKLPACHASKLTLPFVWSPVSKRLLSPDCQSELSSTPASQELRHTADSSTAAEIKLLQSMRLSEWKGNVLLFVCECMFQFRARERHVEAVCSHIHDTLSSGDQRDDTVWIQPATCSNPILPFFHSKTFYLIKL